MTKIARFDLHWNVDVVSKKKERMTKKVSAMDDFYSNKNERKANRACVESTGKRVPEFGERDS